MKRCGQARKGVALITVVLVSALIFAAVVGISAKVMSENSMVAAASVSQRALAGAETGLSQVLFNVRNTDFVANTTIPAGYSSAAYLTIDQMRSLCSGSAGYVVIRPETQVPGTATPYVTYQVKVKKASGDTWSPDNQPTSDTHNVVLDVYSMGTAYASSDKAVVLGRKVIMASYAVAVGTSSSSQPQTLKLGILVGGDLNFSGSSQVTGDVFANGNITNKGGGNGNRVDGAAYAGGSVDPNGVSTTRQGSMPTYDIAGHFSALTPTLAWNFKQGAAPYDGSVPGYPDTRGPQIQNIIKAYLPGSSQTSGDTLQNIHAFYNDLMNGSGSSFVALKRDYPGQYEALRAGAKNIAYYSTSGMTFNGSTVSDFGDSSRGYLSFGGVLILGGNLAIESNGTIGNSALYDLTMVVNGSATFKGAGSATFNGLLYVKGNLTAEDETGKDKTTGSFHINGALVTEGTMNVKGNSSIVYHDVGLNTITIDNTTQTNRVTSANMGASSWKETSYDAFSKLGS